MDSGSSTFLVQAAVAEEVVAAGKAGVAGVDATVDVVALDPEAGDSSFKSDGLSPNALAAAGVADEEALAESMAGAAVLMIPVCICSPRFLASSESARKESPNPAPRKMRVRLGRAVALLKPGYQERLRSTSC